MQQALVRLQQAGCEFPLTARQIKINESGFGQDEVVAEPGIRTPGSDWLLGFSDSFSFDCGFWHTLCRILAYPLCPPAPETPFIKPSPPAL